MLYIAVIFAIQCLPDSAVSGWRYTEGDPSGPEHWHVNYSDCGSVMQSPININTSRVLFEPKLKLLNFSDYGITRGVELVLENLGYIAQVDMKGTHIGITGCGLPSPYRLRQVQFHWRSEHSINDQPYPAEIHFVHGQQGLEMSDALTHPYGQAIIAFFVKLGSTNVNYEPLLKYFDDIKSPNTAVTIPTFPISQLLPASNRLDFFTYLGSWTYPPCSENVVWFVAEAVIEISAEQLSMLTQLQNEDGNQMTNTYRPVQQLSHRTILTTNKNYLRTFPSQAFRSDVSGTALVLVVCNLWLIMHPGFQI